MTDNPLQVSDRIFQQVKIAAQEDHVSVDQLMTLLISEGLERRRGLKMLKERANRADVAGALKVLEAVPDVLPEAGDEMPDQDARGPACG